MRFAPYPAVLRCLTSIPALTQIDSAKPVRLHFPFSRAIRVLNAIAYRLPSPQEAQVGDSYLAVQDFSHIRATPSPNWSVLPPDASIIDPQWPLSAVGDVDGILPDLLPSR